MSTKSHSTDRNPDSEPATLEPLPPVAFPPDFSLDLARLSSSQQAIYNCLRAQGWNDSSCSTWLRSVDHMRESLSGWFRAKGWSEEQVRVFHERCERVLPVDVAPPVRGEGDEWQADFDLQGKVLGEVNRRKRVGEEMELGRVG
ncbi:hypothetical protein BDV28DRAFT_145802 [Aspergillus coremiiformis]|uniref:Uncharacterized protein n=1 Tax=Aspergillus coremiiformis TaxID=138285 RepID=A0A5N6ZDL3_9EURO|nr:hypothetical protein BDV28DRAFT_145802 [Aspergillus coremiiformis]